MNTSNVYPYIQQRHFFLLEEKHQQLEAIQILDIGHFFEVINFN